MEKRDFCGQIQWDVVVIQKFKLTKSIMKSQFPRNL